MEIIYEEETDKVSYVLEQHNWANTPEIKTTPIQCIFGCKEQAVVITYAKNGCTCHPNKIQPRCEQHLERAFSTGEELEIIEDFRIPTSPGEEL